MRIHYVASYGHDEFVTLTDAEYAEAWEHGVRIYRSSQGRLKDLIPKTNDGERAQILGAIGECAVAKALNVRWGKTIDSFKRADLPFNIEARVIGVNHYGLRVYERDNDTRRVVGVMIERGKERLQYRIPGWINAKHAKRAEWLMDPQGRGKPVYAVPQENLHSLYVLRELIGMEMRRVA